MSEENSRGIPDQTPRGIREERRDLRSDSWRDARGNSSLTSAENCVEIPKRTQIETREGTHGGNLEETSKGI